MFNLLWQSLQYFLSELSDSICLWLVFVPSSGHIEAALNGREPVWESVFTTLVLEARPNRHCALPPSTFQVNPESKGSRVRTLRSNLHICSLLF